MLSKLMPCQIQCRFARLSTDHFLFLAFGFLLLALPSNNIVYASEQDHERLNRLVQASASTDPAVVAFREGRDLIADQKWVRAAARFSEFINEYPKDKNVDAALYWLAYANAKQGKYRDAEKFLVKLVNEYPNSNWKNDAQSLRVQIANKVGNTTLVTQEAQRAADDEIKLIALQSLCQADAVRCTSLVTDILKPGSRSSTRIKESAITLLGRYGGKQITPVLLNMARSEPDIKLRKRAITALGASGDESVLSPLRELVTASDNNEITEAALYAIAQHSNPRAIRILGEVATSGKSLDLRKRAILIISRRSGEEAVDELLRLYNADQNPEIRKQVILGFGNRKSIRAQDKLSEIARNSDNIEFRKAAISSLIRRGGDQVVNTTLQLYDAEKNEELKDYLFDAFSEAPGKQVQRKLMDVVRTKNAPINRRRKAILILSRSKDPEVLKFLEEMVQ